MNTSSMPRVLIPYLAFTLLLASLAYAADLSGTWSGWIPGPDGYTGAVLTIAAAGDSLTGTMQRGEETLPIADVNVRGDTFSFDTRIGGGVVFHYCTVSGDSIRMLISEPRGPETQVILHREPESK